MDGTSPSEPAFSIGALASSRSVAGRLLRFIWKIGFIAGVASRALVVEAAAVQPTEPSTVVDLTRNGVGNPPTDFEFGVTGAGELGRWTVVADSTTASQVAIEHVTRDINEDRFR